MWIVRLALERPYTFVVMALLILVLGATSIQQMRTDIFPEIEIPVVNVIWTFKGMEASELGIVFAAVLVYLVMVVYSLLRGTKTSAEAAERRLRRLW